PTSCRAGATCACPRSAPPAAAPPSPASSTTTRSRGEATMPEGTRTTAAARPPEATVPAAPSPGGAAREARGPGGAPLLDVRHLRKLYPIKAGPLKRTVGHVRAVDDVSFKVHAGESRRRRGGGG